MACIFNPSVYFSLIFCPLKIKFRGDNYSDTGGRCSLKKSIRYKDFTHVLINQRTGLQLASLCWIMIQIWINYGGEMTGLFRKSLGIILLLATISLATCQSMINVASDKVINITDDKSIGDT